MLRDSTFLCLDNSSSDGELFLNKRVWDRSTFSGVCARDQFIVESLFEECCLHKDMLHGNRLDEGKLENLLNKLVFSKLKAQFNSPPVGHSGWRSFAWRIFCRIVAHGGDSSNFFNKEVWTTLLIKNPKYLIECQGYVPSDINFKFQKERSNPFSFPAEELVRPTPRAGRLFTHLDTKGASPLKGLIFNDYPQWLDVPKQKEEGLILLVEVNTYLSRKASQDQDEIFSASDSDTILVNILGNYTIVYYNFNSNFVKIFCFSKILVLFLSKY